MNPHALRRFRWLRGITSFASVLRNKTFRLSHGRTRLLVRFKARSFQPRLSVIVPVYNKAATFAELIERLLNKMIDGLEIEVVLVESNSTDGIRDLVLRYKKRPRALLILEETPKGKGHAVRTGLKAATGEIVLFQDADLEYDIDDYDALVAPLLPFQNDFVLGSRHSISKNRWRIRQFSDSRGLAAFFNFGHILFLTLFNVLYSQRLTDPFTMFKVFWARVSIRSRFRVQPVRLRL
jgi:glycosyltransferase involved in cell wall biosynthesis